jgi:hypothetical protein
MQQTCTLPHCHVGSSNISAHQEHLMLKAKTVVQFSKTGLG